MNMAQKKINPDVVELCHQSFNCFSIGPLITSSAVKPAVLWMFDCSENPFSV